jgi:cytochrome c-type biogenesis protein
MSEISNIGLLTAFAASIIMLLTGVAMITGKLTAFSFWLLETLPVLGRIG